VVAIHKGSISRYFAKSMTVTQGIFANKMDALSFLLAFGDHSPMHQNGARKIKCTKMVQENSQTTSFLL